MTELRGAASGDRLEAHDLFRMTFVPASALLMPFLSHWRVAGQGVFDGMTGSATAYPVQGTPTIVDDAHGKSVTFDVKVRMRAVGQSLQTLVDDADGAYPTTRLAVLARITAGVAAAADAPAAQQAVGQAAAATVTNPLTGAVESAVSLTHWVVAGLVAVAIIAAVLLARKVV